MFRFTFNVKFTNKDGGQESADFVIDRPGDNLFDARAQLVYILSRNPHVFSPFSFELISFEEIKE
jgi:hypothetical protein